MDRRREHFESGLLLRPYDGYRAAHPGWVRTKMGGRRAPVDIETGQKTQSWLAVSDEPTAQVSGHYWQDHELKAL